MKKALFTAFSLSKEESMLLKNIGVEVIGAKDDLSEKELIEKLKDCQIYIIGGSDRATENVIKSTNLELIIFYGTGYEDYIHLPSAKARNIRVAYTPKANAYTVAEHTVALILDSVKQVTYLNNCSKKGEWKREETWNLENKNLGIIGLGSIGGFVADIMHNGFKMKVQYVSRRQKKTKEKELNAKKVTLSELLSTSDIVSIHTPLNSETREMLGKEQFQLMKENSILINSSRAYIVEPKSLKEALKKNIIAAAAFDSYYEEPAPLKEKDKWGLLALPDNKFLLTPHNAYNSKDAVISMNKMVIENIESYLKRGVPKYKVN